MIVEPTLEIDASYFLHVEIVVAMMDDSMEDITKTVQLVGEERISLRDGSQGHYVHVPLSCHRNILSPLIEHRMVSFITSQYSPRIKGETRHLDNHYRN